eukprot:263966-Rhodomonas_salina.1
MGRRMTRGQDQGEETLIAREGAKSRARAAMPKIPKTVAEIDPPWYHRTRTSVPLSRSRQITPKRDAKARGWLTDQDRERVLAQQLLTRVEPWPRAKSSVSVAARGRGGGGPRLDGEVAGQEGLSGGAVSYTHLTLPTICSV